MARGGEFLLPILGNYTPPLTVGDRRGDGRGGTPARTGVVRGGRRSETAEGTGAVGHRPERVWCVVGAVGVKGDE
jgi:hypothetical protein